MPSAGRGRSNWPSRFQRAAAGESLNESERSTTTVPQYQLTVARPSTPTEAEAASAANEAGQVLSDVVKALDEPVVPLPSRNGLWDPAHSARRRGGAGDRQQEPRWRTAGLAYPCSCNLPLWPRAYGPPVPPPTTGQLSKLPPDPEAYHLPLFGNDVPPWASGESKDVDLDPALDSITEFECEWQSATPWPKTDKGKGRAAPPPRPSSPTRTRPSPPAPASQLFVTQRSPSSPPIPPRTQRPAIATSSDVPHPPPAPPAPWQPQSPSTAHRPPPSSAISTPETESSPLSGDYVEDARERRAWWRDECDAGGYGAFWTAIKRTSYPAPHVRVGAKRRHSTREDAYRVPRNLAALDHPLHPDIGYYCAHAKTRVYWLIPIHGPVIVPGLQDPITTPSARPWASRAVFAATLPDVPASRPAVVRWTPALLETFMKDRFECVWKDPERPYGPLHLTFSGPKPDPYLALPAPRPLAAHEYLPPGNRGRAPVRVEAGDHMRIYCDAGRALSLRTWLHWWEVEGSKLGDGEERMRPFDKARFALVGPRGEVLVVA